MSLETNSNKLKISQISDDAASSAPMLEQGALSAEPPGVVIPGERLSDSPNTQESESYELASVGKRAVFIAHPIPSELTPGYAAFTDYLNCTFAFESNYSTLANFFKNFADVAGSHFLKTANRGKGMNGYEHSYALGEDGAMFCYGGQRNTALLMLPGKACHTIADWNMLVEFLRDRCRARITRWDGAVDDFEGTHSVDWSVEQYKLGNFTNGGNKPTCKQNGNWIDSDGSGRTFYVGKRQNGKMLRVYEKGMQLCDPLSPWVRYEVELHNVDRVVPWEVLIDPGKYVAGAYPKALIWINEEMSRIRTIKTETKIAYNHLVKHASNAYGRLLNVMLEVEESPALVIEKLRKSGLPKRLQMPIVGGEDQ